MSDTNIVDARGLSCPQPVILTKQALEADTHVKTIVDNETALENIKRLAERMGCTFTVNTADGIYEIHMVRGPNFGKKPDTLASCEIGTVQQGPFVIAITEDKMGRGNEELGAVLIKAFLHTVSGLAKKPDVMIFYNTGVKLAIEGSDVLPDLKQMQNEGVRILVCGTCLNYFEIKDKLSAGVVSNMYDIVETMSRAGRLLSP